MTRYAEATIRPSFEDEVTSFLEEQQGSVEYDRGRWTLRLCCSDREDAETAAAILVEDLMEALGEEACEGTAFRAEVGGESGGRFEIVLEAVDEDGDDEGEDE